MDSRIFHGFYAISNPKDDGNTNVSKKSNRENSESITLYSNWYGERTLQEHLWLVFKVLPSQADDFLWTVTQEDVSVAISMYVNERQTLIAQGGDILVTVVNNIFGGGEKKSKKSASIDHNYPVFTSPHQIRAFMSRK